MQSLPKKFGPITLMRKLGSDGVTESFVGILDEPAGKQVVAHMALPAVLQEAAKLAALEQRVQDLCGVRHPSLVAMLDPVTVDDQRCFLEEHNDGLDLQRVLDFCREHRRTIPGNVYLNLATQICNGLEALHGRPGKGSGAEHVLHLALQPSGLFVQSDGKLLVGGFGLQRSPTAAAGATLARVEFLSPEQTHPDQKLTPASDIFALGALLYELLTLEPLFKADSALQTIHRIRRAEVATQLSKVKEVMPGLDKVLYRALSLNARHRYQRAFVLREDLRGLMSGYSFARIVEESRDFFAPILESRGRRGAADGNAAEPPSRATPSPAPTAADEMTDPNPVGESTMSMLRKATAGVAESAAPADDGRPKVEKFTESHTSWVSKQDAAANRAAALEDSDTSWEAMPKRGDSTASAIAEAPPVKRTPTSSPKDAASYDALRPSAEPQNTWVAPPKTGVLPPRNDHDKQVAAPPKTGVLPPKREFDDAAAAASRAPTPPSPAKKSLRDASPPPTSQTYNSEVEEEPEAPSRLPMLLGGVAVVMVGLAAVSVLVMVGVGSTFLAGGASPEGTPPVVAPAPETPTAPADAAAPPEGTTPPEGAASPQASAPATPQASPAAEALKPAPAASPEPATSRAADVAPPEPVAPRKPAAEAPAPAAPAVKPERTAAVAEPAASRQRKAKVEEDSSFDAAPAPEPARSAKKLPVEVAPPKVAPIADLVGPTVPTDLAALSGRANTGQLTSDERESLRAVPATDASWSRSQILLYEDAKARSDRGAARQYLDAVMALPENQYNPTLLVEQASVAFDKRDYKTAIDRATRAEQNWARLPSDLVFSRKALMYELQAASWQGRFYDSGGEDLESLNQAIRGWQKYQRHVNTKSRSDLSRKADAEIRKLTDMQQRLE
jgi:serine/threonine protein kinase